MPTTAKKTQFIRLSSLGQIDREKYIYLQIEAIKRGRLNLQKVGYSLQKACCFRSPRKRHKQ